MDEFFVRATLVKERIDRLVSEAQRATPERVEAIAAEVDVLYANLVGIREEQLIAQLPAPKSTRKRWWRRG